MRVAVRGTSGYLGGELLRILLRHPHVELVQATSDSYDGQLLHAAHPNLRGASRLLFSGRDVDVEADVMLLATPTGASAADLARHRTHARVVIDLGRDFRDKARLPGDASNGNGFVAGFPEFMREEIRDATQVSMPGCMANAAVLALRPLVAAGLVVGEVIVDGRVGSSGSGAQAGPASHHPERHGALRVYQPIGHRHAKEIGRACGVPVRMSATGTPSVRGSQVLVHATPTSTLTPRDVWQVYREHYQDEPFVRLVNDRRGVHRLPDPKLLLGSNYCDIGFRIDEDGKHLVLVAALDNLTKGGAGNAVQCLNIIGAVPEDAGLEFLGLHPL